MADPDITRLNWISRSLHIIDKAGRFRLLVPNEGQLLLHAEIQQQRSRDLPVRIVLLKPRQVGWSTWTEAEAFYDVYHTPNINAMAVSVDADSTDVIFGMTKRFHSSMPRKLSTDNTNKKAIIFSEPHRSAFYAQTAGKVGVGRSFQCRFLHGSEVAFWNDASTQLAGLYQMVPEMAGTTVILESTANGMGGAFYDKYMEAKDREKYGDMRDYRAVFFPWYAFREYAIEPPEGWEPNHDEKELTKEFGLTNAQLYWRQLKIREMDGDEALFRQEYPATDLEAFQTTGAPVFDVQTVNFQVKTIRDDFRRGMFDPDGDFIEGTSGWKVLDDAGGDAHVIGADTGEHRLTDESNPRSERDYDGIVVMSRNLGHKKVKAVLSDRMAARELAWQVLGAARYYNQAWVVPEVPQGMMVVQTLRDSGYEKIYSRRAKEDSYAPEDIDLLGYRTTKSTRYMLVNETIPFLRSQNISCQFLDIVEQMRTFIYDKTGKPIHMPGKHDDLLFGLFLAVMGDIYCPRDVDVMLPATTGSVSSEKNTGQLQHLGYSGAIDNLEDIDFDDDAWYMTC